MENEDLKEWKPTHPRLAMVGEYLKRVKEASLLGSLIAGDKGELLERIAFEQPLTTGKGMTTGLRSEATELADVIPGPTSIGKAGAKMAGVIGPLGMMNLGDETLKRSYGKLLEALKKANPKDWLTQKVISEDAGFVPIPRGRDMSPDRSTIKVGYEIPEGQSTHRLIDATGEVPTRTRGGGYKARAMDESMPFTEAYEAPQLLRAYPSMRKTSISGDPRTPKGGGYFDPHSNVIGLGPQNDPMWLEEIMAHEIQHKIQSVEGWPGGTNSTAARILLRDLKNPSPKEALNPDRLKLALKQADLLRIFETHPETVAEMMYRREAGEQLAVAAAASHVRGGGKVAEEYTSPFYRMYDAHKFPLTKIPDDL